MSKAGGYILHVPVHRRSILTNANDLSGWFYSEGRAVAEPVPVFQHSRNVPLIIFASFRDGFITHIADGKRGVSAGTDLVRLNLLELQELSRPIPFEEILEGADSRVSHHLDRVLKAGGLLPPKSLGVFVDRILKIDDSVAGRLRRFSEARRKAVASFAKNKARNLAIQQESLSAALEIGGINRDQILEWEPEDGAESFLAGLPEARVREDVMILRDFDAFSGFKPVEKAATVASKTFRDQMNPENRVTVVMANRQPLEEQTGADLIYYNEAFNCFVMVQYKAMEMGDSDYEFRWSQGDQLEAEIQRMDAVNSSLRAIQSGTSPSGFRFSEDPFFLKFCPRLVFNPDDKGMIKGIYLPLALWKKLVSAGQLIGPRGGNLMTYQNVGRRLTNTEFANLVRKAWIGTTVEQSSVLEGLIRQIIQSGKTVTFAYKHSVEVRRAAEP